MQRPRQIAKHPMKPLAPRVYPLPPVRRSASFARRMKSLRVVEAIADAPLVIGLEEMPAIARLRAHSCSLEVHSPGFNRPTKAVRDSAVGRSTSIDFAEPETPFPRADRPLPPTLVASAAGQSSQRVLHGAPNDDDVVSLLRQALLQIEQLSQQV